MFQIVVDSAANIPAELVKKYQIQVLSFVNYVDGKELVCFDPSLSPEEEREKGKKYYDAMRAGMDVKTGLISSGDFENCFRSIMEQNEDVLYFSLSKNISGTFNSARLAAETLMENPPCGRKIRMIDSLNASLAQGILAIYASEMRSQGIEVDAAADLLETYPAKMNGVFTVGDLKYLAKTGRLSGSAALVGNLLKIKPILFGGGQQNGMRSGTENVPGIAGMAKAIEIIYSRLDEDVERLYCLKEAFVRGIQELPDVIVNGHPGRDGAPHVVSVSFAGVRSEVILHALEDKGIYVSAGSACSAHKPQPSATLQAMGIHGDQLGSTIRFSFSVENTMEEVDYTLQTLYDIIPVLRKFTRK